MATRKPTPPLPPKRRPVVPPFQPEPTPFSIRKPRPVVPPFPAQKQTPIDMVRDPGFDSAMANQNFLNSLAQLRAKAAAERGTPTPSVGKRDPRDPNTQYGGPVREPKAPRQPRPSGQDPRDQNTRYEGPKAPTQPRPSGPDFVDNRDPNMNYTMNMVNYIDPATGEVTSRTKGIVPGPGSRFVRYYGPPPEGQGGSMTGFVPVPRQRPLQSEIDKKYIDDGRGGRILNPIDAAKVKSQFDQIQANIAADPNPARYFPIVKIQMPGSDALNQDLANRGMGGGIPAPIPQNPQMQTYNNLLQQGIQRSNTMNQDAASNFANMQAGAPIPQPAAPAKANPTMPIAGMGMQQPKATPVPRKFSTVNTPSARFG